MSAAADADTVAVSLGIAIGFAVSIAGREPVSESLADRESVRQQPASRNAAGSPGLCRTRGDRALARARAGLGR